MATSPFGGMLAMAITVASLAVGPLIPVAAAAEATLPHTAHNKQVVTEAFDRWAAGGTAFFGEVLAPEVVWTIAGSSPSSGTYRGREDFIARAVLPFVSRLRTPVRPTSRQIWADGEHVIIQWAGNAVARDGRPYRNDYVWIFRMRAGKAVDVTAFLDLVPYDAVIHRLPGTDTPGT
ncbi:nuclear transport factor 2 family protein [Stenotrophomonas rhizophila]|nr:nuclear transport factor 2 family protein [Stenotrophomonas rhizophila]